jgi:5,10-methylenetetrahydromethanopterin reductase
LPDISISSDGRDAPSAFADKIAAGETGGAATLWIANHLFQRDPVTLAALALARTARMNVALMAINPFTTHPVQAAMAAATLDEIYPGRVTLCLGVGAPADLKAVGLDATKPLKAMREALGAIRGLLQGETVRFAGDLYQINDRRLATGGRAVPLVLAASGPQMLELAGAVADGVLISAGTSVEFVRQTLERVHHGAKGRKVRAAGLVYSSIDDHPATANDRLRRVLAILLRGAHHQANLALAGSVLDQAALNAAVLAENWPRAEALIGDDIVRRHAASGSAGEVKARFAAYHAAGLDEIVISGARDGDQITRMLRTTEGVS